VTFEFPSSKKCGADLRYLQREHGLSAEDLAVPWSYIWDAPKWMVKIMENLQKMDDLGGKPTI